MKGKGALLAILLTEIKQEGLPAPTLEHRFHGIRRWRFDLAWLPQRVGMEIHGGVYAHGHHTRGKGFEDDREKSNEAQLLGWRVLRYSPQMIKNDPINVIKQIEKVIRG